MYGQLQTLIQRRMDLLLRGEHAVLAADYIYPLPIHLRHRRHILHTPFELEAALARLSADLSRRGVARIEARIDALEIPRLGRFRLWVSRIDLSASGERLGERQYLNYCRLWGAAQTVKTEMTVDPGCPIDWISARPTRRRA
jgi:hypothetical protein